MNAHRSKQVIMTQVLVIVVVLSLMMIPSTMSLSPPTNDIVIKNRILTSDTTSLDNEMNYFLVEVDSTDKAVYNSLKKIGILKGLAAPGVYILKAKGSDIAKLHAVHRVWEYASETNMYLELVDEGKITVSVILFENNLALLQSLTEYGRITTIQGILVTMETHGSLLDEIALLQGVEWIEPTSPVQGVNDAAVVVTGVAQERVDYGLYGGNQIIAIADSGLDTGVNDGTLHNDFQGRIVSITDLSTSTNSSGSADKSGHGTHVAGTALGNGVLSGSNPADNIYGTSYAGVAPEARLVFQAIGSDSGGLDMYPDYPYSTKMFQPAFDQGARVHSNSWGSTSLSLMGNYTAGSRDIDQFVWNNQEMVIVYAAGNYGLLGDNTVLPQAASKNTIAVGGVENYKPELEDYPGIADNPDDLYAGSSRGPTDDGRIKPDVLAPATQIFSTRSRVALPSGSGGVCVKNQSSTPGLFDLGPDYSTCMGTSMATPHVAGMASILREYYITEEGVNPSAALVKASLINSAQDIGFGIVSNASGWGRANLSQVLPGEHKLFFKDSRTGIATGETDTYTLLAGSGKRLKITLVWMDYPGSFLSSKKLVNDLDVVVTDSQGSVYNGNDFTFPYYDEQDSINNVEQVLIDQPVNGKYTISISGADVPYPDQPYALVVTHDLPQRPRFSIGNLGFCTIIPGFPGCR